MHFICRSFIGSHSSTSWSQYWENEPDDFDLASQKGHLFGLINLDETTTLGRDIIFELNQNYYSSDTSLDVISSLKNTLNSILENPLFTNSGLTILVAIVLKNRLYLAILGNGRVILSRQNKIASILVGHDNEITTISGPVFSQDKILLTTDLFFRSIGWNRIKYFLSENKIQTIEENFLSALYSLNNQENQSAALIQTQEEENLPPTLETDREPDSIETKATTFPKKNILKKFFSKPVFVSYHDSYQVNKRKKINLAMAITLLLGLGLISYVGYRKNKASRIETQYQQFKTELDQKINNTLTLKNLNINSALESAKELQTIYQQMSILNIHSSELADYQKNINILLTQTGSDNTFAPDFFYDTSLIVNNPQFNHILLNNNKLYLLDSNTGRIDLVDTDSKSIKNLLINNQLKGLKNIIENSGSFYVYNSDSLSLITKTGLDSKIKFTSPIIPTSVQSWNGAFYVLDPSNSTIWKYAPNSSGFGAATKWLKEGEKTSADATSLAINGKVWTLSTSGQITPYSLGSKSEFKLNQKLEINNADNLATTTTGENLVFVGDDNVVYIINKDGNIISKYNLGSLKALDLTLNKNTVFVLCSDQKIYKINL
ncbi:MAG: PP2C family serine/threonine-protein phosphatase [Candidatus Shapirobacteria bacterium]|nr:PP2C family serine/threonine-protein phosphatase [Candidatus Shapirobacteria bacterium]